jgi:processive 1,2-diacylglycerol beta-glucosyltransferase
VNKNLLILSSSTGGGHNMRANALKHWWQSIGGNAIVSQPLETTSSLYKFGSNFYNFIQRFYPALHLFYFHFLEIASFHRNKRTIIGADPWLKEIKDFNPKLVLSVHAHLNHGYLDLLRDELDDFFKFAIYCGELADGNGFSRHWVNPMADYFLGPFDETCKAAKIRNMPVNKTLTVGPILRKAFYRQSSEDFKNTVFNKYQISPDIPIFLLGTGANGVNRHIDVLNSLKNHHEKFQVIALCGSNLKIFTKIQEMKKNLKFNILPLKTIEDKEMALFLREAKFLFARPGAGTTTEALICGTPMIFDVSRGIMPQEFNNLNFWKLYSSEILCLKEPKNIYKFLGKPIPKIKINASSSPKVLLDHLELICS